MIFISWRFNKNLFLCNQTSQEDSCSMSYQEVHDPLSLIRRCQNEPYLQAFCLLLSLSLLHDAGNHFKVGAIYCQRGAPPPPSSVSSHKSPSFYLFIFLTWSKRGRQWISGDYHRPRASVIYSTVLRNRWRDITPVCVCVCRLQLQAALIFISLISPPPPIGMCAQLSLFSTFWRACRPGRAPWRRALTTRCGGEASREWRWKVWSF